MRGPVILLAAGLALAMGGCSLLDWAVGIRSDGSRDPAGGPVGAVAPFADVFLPGAGAVLAAAGGLWAALRGRKWKQAAISTFETIEAGARAGKGVRDLKKDLARAHEAAGIYGLVKAVVDRYGHSREAPLQVLPTPPPQGA